MSISQEQPPQSVDEDLRAYLARRFVEIGNELDNSNMLIPTSIVPVKPVEGAVYYFPEAVPPEIPVAGVYVWTGDAWGIMTNNLFVPAGHGGMRVINGFAGQSIPSVWTDIANYSQNSIPDVFATTNLINGTIAPGFWGVWRVSVKINIDHDEQNGSRAFYVRLFDKETNTPSADWTVPIARNQSGSSDAFTFLSEVLEPEVNNEYVLQWRSDDSIAVTLVNMLSYDINHVGSLGVV